MRPVPHLGPAVLSFQTLGDWLLKGIDNVQGAHRIEYTRLSGIMSEIAQRHDFWSNFNHSLCYPSYRSLIKKTAHGHPSVEIKALSNIANVLRCQSAKRTLSSYSQDAPQRVDHRPHAHHSVHEDRWACACSSSIRSFVSSARSRLISESSAVSYHSPKHSKSR